MEGTLEDRQNSSNYNSTIRRIMKNKKLNRIMRLLVGSKGAVLALGLLVATPLWSADFSFTTGNPDGLMGAASRRASPGKLETETADDFTLDQTTVISRATIVGLVPSGTQLRDIKEVEVEVYHVFPLDSAMPPSGKVPSRANSPSDVEIGTATRAGNSGTLTFSTNVLNSNFGVGNTVVNNLKVATAPPGGEGSTAGEEVEITITFTSPIILPAGHYFFRPEVLLTSGDFLYLSAPKVIPAPKDLQAWIRNSNLAPDWLRIGTDIVGGTTAPQFNMTFSLAGETVPEAGTPGETNCKGKSISALSQQFGSIDDATSALGFSSVAALQDGVNLFCQP
jgi:hypothetical protein